MDTETPLTKTCGCCKNWFLKDSSEGECRYGPPVAGVGWPTVKADGWCGRFSRTNGERGAPMKFTDEMVMKIVAEECAPFEVNGVMVSGGAIARTDLVRRIMALGVSQTPAYNRIEKLVNAGLLVEGNNPFDSQKRGIHVWLPKQEADPAVEDTTSKGSPRNSEVLEIVRSLAPDAEHPMPLRAMHREKGEAAGMSFTGFYRAVQGLLEAKLVASNDVGYYAVTATQMEVDV